MRWFSFWGSAALVIAAATGCGGGSSGSNFGSLLQPLSITVTVNGKATDSGGGHIAVKPGDQVTLTPNQNADWSTASTPSGAVTPRNPDISALKWAAQLVNTTVAQGSFTVSAKAASNPVLSKDVVFDVAPGDVRNATYKVFASNGTKPSLALNFDTMSYTMTDPGGDLSDSFAPDPSESGTYIFSSTRKTAQAITTRFRMSGDTVVGTFPFAVTATLASNTYTSQPFVASRALVTSQTGLDGIYNRLSLSRWIETHDKTLHNSEIRQIQVSAAGTVMLLCTEPSVTSVAGCPPSSIKTYSVSAAPLSGEWNIVNVADSSDNDVFSVIRVGGKNVYVAAGPYSKLLNSMVFRIGLVEASSWSSIRASGGDTAWNWGSMDFDASTYSTVRAAQDGTTSSFSAGLSSPSPTVAGLRAFSNSGGNYFAVQDGILAVVVGAPSPPATAPFDAGDPVSAYLQIGLAR